MRKAVVEKITIEEHRVQVSWLPVSGPGLSGSIAACSSRHTVPAFGGMVFFALIGKVASMAAEE
jgi:hypothetical protein